MRLLSGGLRWRGSRTQGACLKTVYRCLELSRLESLVASGIFDGRDREGQVETVYCHACHADLDPVVSGFRSQLAGDSCNVVILLLGFRDEFMGDWGFGHYAVVMMLNCNA